MRHDVSRESGFAAALADTVHFKRLCLRTEAEGLGLCFDQFGDAFVAHFLRTGTNIADQERHLMRFGRMVARDEGVDRFQLMDKTMLEQKIERAINRGRRSVAVALADDRADRKP
jgi:hypothetical protein